MVPALFLDRDGVINIDHGYVHRVADFEFVDGIFDLARSAVAAGYVLIVVTNQAGIGRGYYTEAQFLALSDWMRAQFAAAGAPITDVYFCPHHPDHGIGVYHRDCPCRKPNPGMIIRAGKDHDLDMRASILVGDTASDIEAANRAGVGRTVLFGQHGATTAAGLEPTFRAANHAEVTAWLHAHA